MLIGFLSLCAKLLRKPHENQQVAWQTGRLSKRNYLDTLHGWYQSWWPVSSNQLFGFVSWKRDVIFLISKLLIGSSILTLIVTFYTKYNQTGGPFLLFQAEMFNHFCAMDLLDYLVKPTGPLSWIDPSMTGFD